MSKLGNNHLANHIIAWFFLLTLSFLGCYYLISHAVYISSLRTQASSIADMVTHVGHWAGQFKGGIWVKSGVREHFNPQDYLDKKTYVVDQLKDDKKRTIIDHYHLKNPSLIQRELSDITLQNNANVIFRITSDNFLNPHNAPNGFEQTAIALIKEEFHRREYYKKTDSRFLYAREITAEKSCLSCHGDPKNAPKKLQELYPGDSGFNYEQGRLAGIVSVSLPYNSGLLILLKSVNVYSLIAIGLFFILLICFILYILIFVVSPIKKITSEASKAIQSIHQDREENMTLFHTEYKSSTEIRNLNKQFKTLYSLIKDLKKFMKMHDF
ncbi:DUF3365 domain-containing protein [Endozoicomonas sp. SM1973]|uniref:DUF3365 domain-containing protein n=1 Tax=Spartinivicinus marinus TaxID=2994442 RepID=A0A853HWS4_9GAMM|nr:DUF3365 domain-containing protein [Spartinivicinus marinus]MCX4029917.1 DUF3365 domain-containing protein [Spartinivicinus marinus]NYZ64839.1 DUF3365 domain-containing protein [Spartinivicinus marinus]